MSLHYGSLAQRKRGPMNPWPRPLNSLRLAARFQLLWTRAAKAASLPENSVSTNPPGWWVDSYSVLFFLHQSETTSFSKGRRSFIFPLKDIKRKTNQRRRKREREEEEKGKEGRGAIWIRSSVLDLGEGLQARIFWGQLSLPPGILCPQKVRHRAKSIFCHPTYLEENSPFKCELRLPQKIFVMMRSLLCGCCPGPQPQISVPSVTGLWFLISWEEST